MYPACWFVQLCILVPQPTRSINQRHSIRSPVESTIKMLISELARLSPDLVILGVEGESKKRGKVEALSKELNHRIWLPHLVQLGCNGYSQGSSGIYLIQSFAL